VLAWNRLLLAAREAESGEADAEKRECGGFGDAHRNRGHGSRERPSPVERDLRDERRRIHWTDHQVRINAQYAETIYTVPAKEELRHGVLTLHAI
jgi:hypothetical protein